MRLCRAAADDSWRQVWRSWGRLMKELTDIITLSRSRQLDQAALATVVRIEGSSYRRPGASLLIGADGRRLGSVSGGCLERDVESHAKAVMASGEPRLVTYDTRPDSDLIFGTALGCGGLVEVFIERIDLTSGDGPVARWAAAADRRETLAELIVVSAPPGSPLGTGERTWLVIDHGNGGTGRDGVEQAAAESADTSHDSKPGMPGHGSSARVSAADSVAALIAAARPDLDARQSSLVLLSTPAGEVRAFLRVIEPPVRLLVCGAGDDAQPIVAMAKFLGWRVWVLDHRPAFATLERFPGADRVEVTIAGTLPSDFIPDPRTVAIVMNHHYPSDGAWLSTLAPLPLTYLGLLGARHRTARLLRDAHLPPAGPGGLERLFAPAGLDIGAEGPEAIALAMLAEMQAVLAGRRGGLLRESLQCIQPAGADVVGAA
jgi:xanthine dehydrogenase accessory factor